jgi:hypothetical protein
MDSLETSRMLPRSCKIRPTIPDVFNVVVEIPMDFPRVPSTVNHPLGMMRGRLVKMRMVSLVISDDSGLCNISRITDLW